MSEAEQYLLKFDLSEFTQQLNTVRDSYGDLGSSIEQVFNTSTTAVQEFVKNIDTLSASIGNASSVLDTTYSVLNGHMKESASILSEIEKSGKGLGSLALSGVGATTSTADQVKDIYPGMAEKESQGAATEEAVKSAALATEAMGVADKALKGVGEAKKEIKEEISGIGKIVRKEIAGIKKGVGGLLKNLTGGVSFGGGLFAGLIGAMILGVHHTQRLEAESNEIANVFESSVDGLGSRATKKAIGWLGDFQEQAQKFFNIGRKEVQSQVASFVEMGYKTEQFMDRFDKSLGLVGANIPTLTLALEKHFNLSSGSAAKNINTMVRDYGDSLDEATDKFLKLSFAAQKSGIGVSNFVNNIMSGTQAMRQYGIDVEDVAHVMQTLQGYYEGILGPDKSKKAGGMAGEALGAIAGVMGGGMSEQFEMAVAQKVEQGYGGWEARQRLRSGMGRVAAGEDEGYFIRMIKAAVAVAKEQGGGSDVATKEILMQQARMSVDQAQALIDIAPDLKEGVKLQEGTKEQLKELKKSFDTEGSVLTELQKTQNKLVEGMAKIGEGLLSIVGGILGAVITAVNSIPLLYKALTTTDSAERDKIFDTISDTFKMQGNLAVSGIDKILEGGGKMSDALKGALKDTSAAMKAAMEMSGPEAPSIADYTKKMVKNMGYEKGSGSTLIRGLIPGEAGEDIAEGYEKINDKLRDLGNDIWDKFGEIEERERESIEEAEKPAATGIPVASMGGQPSVKAEFILDGRQLLSAVNNATAAQA